MNKIYVRNYSFSILSSISNAHSFVHPHRLHSCWMGIISIWLTATLSQGKHVRTVYTYCTTSHSSNIQHRMHHHHSSLSCLKSQVTSDSITLIIFISTHGGDASGVDGQRSIGDVLQRRRQSAAGLQNSRGLADQHMPTHDGAQRSKIQRKAQPKVTDLASSQHSSTQHDK